MDLVNDEYYMRLAIGLAQGTTGQTGINPQVGCVIVKDGSIVGLGAHLKQGLEHAEIHALQMAGEQASGATVYVTLEPCSHYGRTPPCCERLIAANLACVVIACKDPNPLVAGKGISKLKEHGIEVRVGILEQEAVSLNEKYIKYITKHLPYVSVKAASTLDGKIASFAGDSRWITNEQSRERVHTLRHQNQAIMVGVDTVIADDPQLTARLPVMSHNPIRIIVDSTLRIPINANLWNEPVRTILLTTSQAKQNQMDRLQKLGAEIIVAGEGTKVDLLQAMHQLAAMEIGSILLEGGGRLNGAMLAHKLIDKCYLFYAMKIIGGENARSNFSFSGFAHMDQAIKLDRISIESFGQDICIIGYPQYEGDEASVYRDH